METVKAYVLVSKDGTIISRPFGSEMAALKASKYKRFEDNFFGIRQIDLDYETVEPEKPDVNYGRITE